MGAAPTNEPRRFCEWQGWHADGLSKAESRGDVDLDEVRYARADLT